MAGTLLVYDEAFPRARRAAFPIRNTPSSDELQANGYPTPYQLLAVPQASPPNVYFTAIANAATSMGPLDRLIIFGHGHVMITGTTRVTTGIVIGAGDITASNASGLGALHGAFARRAHAELWVCSAASAGRMGGQSGTILCQTIADALGVPVLAATIEQQFDTVDQHDTPDGGIQSTVRFLPWEGRSVRFTPRRRH
jgi:hypothetical protein